jgi:hypothetical protein
MSDKQQDAFVKALGQLSQKKIRAKKARGSKDPTAK